MSTDPVPPRQEYDDDWFPRTVYTLGALAVVLFVSAAMAAYAGLSDMAFALSALVVVIGTVVILAATVEEDA